MRCQIALTLIACRRGMDIGCLPATYNAANDADHFAANVMTMADVRVLHYLREVELERARFLLPGEIDSFLAQLLGLPANRALQDLVREFRATF